MNVILIRKHKGGAGYVNLSRRRMFTFFFLTFVALPGVLLGTGYWLGMRSVIFEPDALHVKLLEQLEVQYKNVEDTTQNARDSMNALAQRLGRMQAHVIRLDSLGQRLTEMASLDKGEFNFERPPGQGGPEGGDLTPLKVPDFLVSLNSITQQLEDRSQQLSVLETILIRRNLNSEVFPAGRPIKRGWISSYFGKRTDPFTGKRAHHAGMDFAGKEGSEVVAVASGVATWAGRRYGYGNLVEINHGNGYVTRYGHNKDIIVKLGETVKKGQLISTMGSTGRSTGPHVHFEVLYNGRNVDPKKYISAVRKN